MRLLAAAGHHLGPGHHHLIAAGAVGVPAAPPWLSVLVGLVILAAVSLYWVSTRV